MKAEKFTGTAIEQLETSFGYLLAHHGHFLLYSFINLEIGAIRCSSCKVDIVEGSREFVELIWLEWSSIDSEV